MPANTDFLIREAHAHETDVVRELFSAYQRDIGIDLCFQSFEEELRTLPGRYTAIFLALQDGEAFGCCALRPLGGATAEMKRLYVRPDSQGLGAGHALAQAVIDRGRAQGYSHLRLDTLPSMDKAIGLYRRLGFSEIAPYAANPVPGALFFELDL